MEVSDITLLHIKRKNYMTIALIVVNLHYPSRVNDTKSSAMIDAVGTIGITIKEKSIEKRSIHLHVSTVARNVYLMAISIVFIAVMSAMLKTTKE